MNFNSFNDDHHDDDSVTVSTGIFPKIMRFFKEHGIYLVLIGCLVVVGVAAAVLFSGNSGTEEPVPMLTPTPKDVSSNIDQQLGDVTPPTPWGTANGTYAPSATATSSPALTASHTPSASATAAPVQKPKLSAPCAGEIIWDFAIDELIYSETLNHWTTHHGVDIAAAVGTTVAAVDDGEVTEVFTDDEFGVTMVITHSNGHKTVYANLKIELTLKVGDKVDAGDVIGQVGETAVAECGMPSHLHFEYYVNNEPVDPKQYVNF